MSSTRAVLLIACLLALSGCKGSGEEEPLEFVSLKLKAYPDLNPNDRGEPTPVDVRIYPLKTPNAFTKASFEELWVKDEDVLGATMAQKPDVVTLEPTNEKSKPIVHKLKMFGGFYVGLLALYSGQPGSGMEERKICVEAKIADGGTFEFSKHKITLVGGGALADQAGEGASDEGASDDAEDKGAEDKADGDGASDEGASDKDDGGDKDDGSE